MRSTFQTLARLKVYFSSAGLYMSIGTFVLLLINTMKTYQLPLHPLLAVVGGFTLATIVGWLDYTLVRRYENEHANRMNDLKEQLNRIEERL